MNKNNSCTPTNKEQQTILAGHYDPPYTLSLKCLKKREWVYCQNPKSYSIVCDKCHGQNIDWSEWTGLIWCYDCQIDTRGTVGIFDGPIPVNACHLFGINLNRICLPEHTLLEIKIGGKNIYYEKTTRR